MTSENDLLGTIRESWRWTGLDAAAVVATNAFGNVIVRETAGTYWRICPEELSFDIIASHQEEFDSLWADEEFQTDWQMTRLAQLAEAALGKVDGDRCYCLKLPAVLGGEYEAANFGTSSRRELISSAGDAARQVKDIPDGARVEFRFVK